MIIKQVAVGNKEEAFVEKNLTSGLNIISSDDNNRGKTIVIQAMMYALGNEPSFPQSFEYKDYYYYIEFECDGRSYYLCRNNSGFILKNQNSLMIFENVSELKRYWTKNIFELPVIVKNEFSKIVDPSLFLQLFFVGQDKKDTSNISKAGQYNKEDFIQMIFSWLSINGTVLDADEVKIINDQLLKLKSEKDVLLKQHKILKSKENVVSYLSSVNDRMILEEKVSNIKKINERIAELRKNRNLILTRRAKWENTIKELNSLNRVINSGELRCMDCNSTNIAFTLDKKASYTFDVSTVQMRSEILSSIREKIDAYGEEIEQLSIKINIEQEKLQEIMKEEDISLEAIVAYKKDYFSAKDAEKRIYEIQEKISELSAKLALNKKTNETNSEKQKEIIKNLIASMNYLYKQIDRDGNLVFDGLFSKRDEIYSGSESTIFHLIKLLSIQKVLKHSFPIIIDSFRAEDLSTKKEKVVLDLFGALDNQIIFTTTLKKEEYGKYKKMKGINNIDYQKNQPSKILQKQYVDEFKMLLLNVSVSI